MIIWPGAGCPFDSQPPPPPSALGNIGGNVGLGFGLSVMTFFELFEYFGCLIVLVLAMSYKKTTDVTQRASQGHLFSKADGNRKNVDEPKAPENAQL